MNRPTPRPAIAVVAASALFPGSQDETGFWRDVLAGRDRLSEVPPTHWLIDDYYDPNPEAPDKTYARRGAFLGTTEFDALSFGVPPSIVPATDTSQLLALIVAQRVLDEASRGQFASLDRDRVSVILGVTSGQELLASMVARLQKPVWVKALREAGLPESKVQEACARIAAHYTPWQESTFPGLLGNVVAGRIANRFDLGGTNCVTDAACASAFSALSMAVNELLLGQSDLVITGGVDTLNDIFMYMCFSKTPALSKSGDCRPFSDAADGTMLGEGLAMVALKRLEDAEAAGDRIHAVLRGVGSSSDGRAKSVYAPRPEGQAKALRRAYEAAGYGPETVELVEAHGTGTVAGDAAEIEGLKQVYAPGGKVERPWCALGSVKSQIGHTKAAAGAAGLLKAILAVNHGALPPTIKVEKPNPALKLEGSPFYLNTEARPWVRGADHPRRASVSSFGFGGSNFHVTLEEYRGERRALRKRVAPSELVVFGAASAPELVRALRGVEVGGEGTLAWLARDTQCRAAKGAAIRVAIVAADEADLKAKLKTAADALERSPDKALSLPGGIHCGAGAHDGKVAFLFPGQGSQELGMGAGAALLWPQALAAWDLAADLPLGVPEKLHEIVFPAPAFGEAERKAQAERLTRTEWAQPALGAASLAHLNLLSALDVKADFAAGHSFGEVMALHAGGAFDAATALRIARKRGELMAEAARSPGAMVAARAAIDEVRAAIAGVEGVVVANHNAPRQVVLSGPVPAIEAAERALSAAKIESERLKVATAFHSSVVASSTRPFAAWLEGIRFAAPRLAVYSNSEAAEYPSDPAAMRALLAGQLARPVRFVEQIEAMHAAGARTFVEVGAGGVLTGLVGRILAGKPHRAVSLEARGKDGATAFHDALGRLWASGLDLDFAALWAPFQEIKDPRRLSKPKLAIPICGANYGKPYPPPEGARALPPPNPEKEPEVVVREVIKEIPVAAAPATFAPGADSALLAAYQQAQRETLEAHTAWQNSMAQTHLAFLQASERSFTGLAAMLGGAALPQAPELPVALPAISMPPMNLPMEPLASMGAPPPVPPAAVAPKVEPKASVSENPKVASAAPAPAATQSPAVDLKATLLAVVAEKTGYPPEMLTLEMGLESDLGIDSIKRVEILSALRAKIPGLGEVTPAAMAQLKTLGAIVEQLQGAATAAPAKKEEPRATPVAEAAAGAATDLKATLLAVVAEKTGYPPEMLNLDMALESDLGIDSIKRVEILSALRAKLPGLGEVTPAAMAKLKTLGAILEQLGGAPAASAPSESPSTRAAEPVRAAPSLGRYAVELVERPAPGLCLPGLLTCGQVLVTPDGSGVAGRLVEALKARGVDAREAAEVPADAAGVVFLGGLRADLAGATADRVIREAFQAARAVAATFSERGGVFVTVQDTGGDFGLSGSDRAGIAGIAGLARTAALEWPKASVKRIDVGCAGKDPAAIAAAIASELLDGGAEPEVGLPADGKRLAVRLVESEIEEGGAPAVDEGSVVVATGGARGVTAACLVALAREARCRFLLLGRSPLVDEPEGCREAFDDAGLKRALLEEARARGASLSPQELGAKAKAILAGREVRATLTAIRDAGGEARYAAADVRSRESLDAALADARRSWGPVTAIVHGAGVLADKLLAEKSDAQFDSVFDTKVLGLRALLEATAQDHLKALILFSSVAARTGNPGQADYAAANEVLNAVACQEARRRGPACRVRALGWGPWDGGMVTPALKAHFQAEGTALLGLEEGARAFLRELRSPGSAQVVIGAPLPKAALRPEASAPRSFEVSVSEASHPYLADHEIGGAPVLPMVLALEWFARAAKAASPDRELVACRDVRVLRGIRLNHYRNGGDVFTITAAPEGDGSRLRLELRGTNGALRYTATAELSERRPTAGAPPPPLPALQELGREIYGRELFHGPQFQVIRSLDGVSREGAAGTLVGTAERGWAGPWVTDPAALDGGLQLALLWTGHVLGGESLPTSVGAWHAWSERAAEGLVRCALRGRVVDEARTVCDIAFVGEDGALLSELKGVEVHKRSAKGGKS